MKKRKSTTTNTFCLILIIFLLHIKIAAQEQQNTREQWLYYMGLCGDQPGLADFYINTGSLYLCTVIFLPLGLPADDPFWNDPDIPWTAKKVWDGLTAPADHSLAE